MESMDDDVHYYYLHEKPQLAYKIEVKPLPADACKAELRLDNPKGRLVHTEQLKRDGDGTFSFDPQSKGIGIADSPIFVNFTFKKGKDVRDKLQVISLAEPAVRSIETPLEASPGDTIALRVTAWDALAWDLPGLATVLHEKDGARILPEARARVRWWLDEKEIEPRGESVETKLSEAHLGKRVTVIGYLGDRLPKGKAPARAMVSAVRRPWAEPATATIAVPRVKIEAPDSPHVGQETTLKASIEPELEGTYTWTAGPDSAPSGEGPRTTFVGRKAGEKIAIECAFTSKATDRVYRARHELTIAR